MDQQKLEIERLLQSLDATDALNILIGAIDATYDSELHNELDRFFITYSLKIIKDMVDKKEPIIIDPNRVDKRLELI